MKYIILILALILAPTVKADPIVNDGMIHDVIEINDSMHRLKYELPIGLAAGLGLMALNHVVCEKQCIDDSWFFLVPVATIGYDVAHIGFHGTRICLRLTGNL